MKITKGLSATIDDDVRCSRRQSACQIHSSTISNRTKCFTMRIAIEIEIVSSVMWKEVAINRNADSLWDDFNEKVLVQKL